MAPKLINGRKRTIARVLGDYIGNAMIGIKSISEFQVLLDGSLKTVTLRERKAPEKGWSKIMSSCNASLDLIATEVAKLELFKEKLKQPNAKSQLLKYAFFLKEICCPLDLINACVAVIDGNPTIKTTIPRPALGDFDRRYAFFKIMSKHDLALYTLVCCREDIRIVVYEGNLRAFTLSLSDLVLDKRCEERVENMECDLVVSKKAQNEE